MSAPGRQLRQVSNRRLIEQMLLWGWTIHRSRGEYVIMRRGAERIAVNAATYHSPNDTATIREVVELTCGGDPAEFWARTAAVNGDGRPVPVEPVTLTSPSQPPPQPEPEQPAMTEPATEEAAVPNRTINNRGLSNKVLEHMLRHQDAPRSGRQVAVALGADQNPVMSAMAYLYKVGLLARVKQGVYRLPEDLRTEHVRIRVLHDMERGITYKDISEVRAVAAESAPPTPVIPLRAEVPVLSRAEIDAAFSPAPPAPPAAEDPDDLIDTVLDMMFPEGFKARHRRTVEAWAEATRKLIAEVGA